MALFYIFANPLMSDMTEDIWILIPALAFHLLKYHFV